MIAVIVPNCLMAGKWMIIVLERRVADKHYRCFVIRRGFYLGRPGTERRLVEEAEDLPAFHATMAPGTLFELRQQ